MKKIKLLLILICVGILAACQREDSDVTEVETGNESKADYIVEMTEDIEDSVENVQDTSAGNETSESIVPTKEQVLAVRENILDGMTTEQIERLTENIKVANIAMMKSLDK